MTLQEILDAAYDDQGYQINGLVSPNPASDVIARFTRWANEGMRDILGRPRLYPLRHGTLTFTTRPGVAVYPLGAGFDMIDTIVNQVNSRRLTAMTRDWYRSIDPGERSQGSSYAWIEEGYAPVSFQPLGTPVYVETGDALAITQTLHIRGTILPGIEIEATVTLNGTTRVLVYPGVHTILTASLSAPTNGLTVLWNDPVATNPEAILGGIGAGTTGTQYHHIRLWPTPSAVEDYLVDGQFRAVALVRPNDVPVLIPQLFHTLIIDYINFQAYAKNGDAQRAAGVKATYERRLNDLTNKVEYSLDFRPVRCGRTPSTMRWSNLPSNYPADGWGR